MKPFNEETVTEVRHWTDRLFSFTTTRGTSLRFKNGHFTMIGLKVNNKPLLRAYSIASANYEETLEFLSIKVPDGALTSRLQHLKPGDELLVGRKVISLDRAIALLAPNPARIFHLDRQGLGPLRPGAPADFVLFDPSGVLWRIAQNLPLGATLTW